MFLFTSLFSQKILRDTRNTFNTFASKITKVVIPSTSLADLMLRDAVNRGWRISPFEFCTLEEFNRIKADTNYFFLMRVDGMYRRDLEPKVEYLTLFKGGPEVKRGLFSSHNIITLPLQQSDDLTGVTLNLLPIYVDIIQNHIYKVQRDLSLAFKGNSFYAERVKEAKGKNILFSKESINYDIRDYDIASMFKGEAKLTTASDIEGAVVNNRENTVVAVVILPKGDPAGSFCYKLMIDTGTHELLFFRRHRISSRMPAGFTREDLRKISAPFQF